MNPITVKPGDDIRWAGQLTREGFDDYHDVVMTAHVRLKPTGAAASPLLGEAVAEWLDRDEGLFLITFPREVTVRWPVNSTLVFDVRIESPDDTWARTATAEIKTLQGVTK